MLESDVKFHIYTPYNKIAKNKNYLASQYHISYIFILFLYIIIMYINLFDRK